MVLSTVVKINPATKGKLDLLKEHPRETYEEVITRLLERTAPGKRGIVAKQIIGRGERLTANSFALTDTDRGLSPTFIPLLEGVETAYDIKQGEPITFGLVNFKHVKKNSAQHPETSVIIRTKNEETWLPRCLTAIAHQEYTDFEIIIVDNESTDTTREIAKQYGCKIVHISNTDFNFSRALNIGVKEAQGKYIAMISGHCIPLNHLWLGNLVNTMHDPEVAGAYGRQEPLPDSDPFDKRDLWTTFGIEKRIQRKDFFFHNANSIIRKTLWEETPFDESIHGVEDRHWAKRMIEKGKTIVYEPEASIYHFHGIHQGRNTARAERVARVIELIQNGENHS